MNILIEENVFENFVIISYQSQYVNSLWSSDAIWGYGAESTLSQVMAWWLTALSHDLIVIEDNFSTDAHDISP